MKFAEASSRAGGAHKTRVSVVIPTRNRLAYLKEAVESVRAQTLTEWELVVVDDASEDGTLAWLQSIPDSRVRPVRLDDRVERAAVRNRGLAEASGRYIVFLDDDDRLRPRALERMHRAFQKDPRIVAACGARIEFDDKGGRKRVQNVWIPRTRTLWPEILARGASGVGQEMFPTDLLRSLGGWNEDPAANVIEDWELRLRVSRKGPIRLLPYAMTEYRQHVYQWKPHDQEQQRRRLMEDFLTSVWESERPLAEGAIQVRWLLHDAQVAVHADDPGSALAKFVDVYRASPIVARSPLMRSRLLRGFSQAIFVRYGGRRASEVLEQTRRGLKRAQAKLGRAPGRAFSEKIVKPGDAAKAEAQAEELRVEREAPPVIQLEEVESEIPSDR